MRKVFCLCLILILLTCGFVFAGFTVGSEGIDPLHPEENSRKFDLRLGFQWDLTKKSGGITFRNSKFGVDFQMGIVKKKANIIPVSYLKFGYNIDCVKDRVAVFNVLYEHVLASFEFSNPRANRQILGKRNYLLFYGSVGGNVTFKKSESRFATGPSFDLSLRYWFTEKMYFNFGATVNTELLWIEDGGINNIAKSDYNDKIHTRLVAAIGLM